MLKSLPLLTAWNNQVNISNALGALVGFFVALFLLAVPFDYGFALPRYALALFWSVMLIVAGFSIVYTRMYAFSIAYVDELLETEFLQIIRKRILKGYFESAFLTGTFVYFAWFLVRTQRQWTEMNIFIAEVILFTVYGLFAILSIREENARILSEYHSLPELEEAA